MGELSRGGGGREEERKYFVYRMSRLGLMM